MGSPCSSRSEAWQLGSRCCWPVGCQSTSTYTPTTTSPPEPSRSFGSALCHSDSGLRYFRHQPINGPSPPCLRMSIRSGLSTWFRRALWTARSGCWWQAGSARTSLQLEQAGGWQAVGPSPFTHSSTSWVLSSSCSLLSPQLTSSRTQPCSWHPTNLQQPACRRTSAPSAAALGRRSI